MYHSPLLSSLSVFHSYPSEQVCEIIIVISLI